MDTNDAEYKDVFIDLCATLFKKKRTSKYVGTYSCRASLLLYIIISITWGSRDRNYIARLISIAETCYEDTVIINFISKNYPYDIGGVPIDNDSERIFNPSISGLPIIYPMGLVNVSDPNKKKHVINHFFAIVQQGSNLFIVSSYGCDSACASQSMILLPLGEFVAFIAALNSNDFNRFTPFMEKYFFPIDYLMQIVYFLDKDTHSRSRQMSFTPDVGVPKELESYRENVFKCFYFPTLVAQVQRVISGGEPESKAGGGRKKRSRKSGKSRKKRSRKKRTRKRS